MNELWQDQIDRTLRTLRHQERHDQLPVEHQRLRRGHVSAETAAEPVLPGKRPRRRPTIRQMILATVEHARRAVVG